MGLTRCYKAEVFLTFIFALFSTFYAISISHTCLSSRKFNCKPNFDKISQRRNRTVGGGVMTSYRFFKMAAIEFEVYFRVHF